MEFHLPPPDPHESPDAGPDHEASLPGPMAVFVSSTPSPDHERVADAILELRPGLLIVCA